MDQKFEMGGLIGYGNSCLDFVFCYSKVFRLHAKLHDAAGAVRTHIGKGTGYLYLIGRGPNLPLLVHVTALLFCLYLKLFLPSNFNSVDFRSSMSCIVVDIEQTDNILVRNWDSFDGKNQGYSVCPPKRYKPTKQALRCTRNLHGIVWNSGRLDYSALSNILPRAVKGVYVAKGTEKCKNLCNLMD